MSTPALTASPEPVELGGFPGRLLAAGLDCVVPAVALTLYALVLPVAVGSAALLVFGTLLWTIVLAWAVYLGWCGAQRTATPGMRLLRVEPTSVRTEPDGWQRFLVRWFVFAVLAGSGLGLALVMIWMVANWRRRGDPDSADAGPVIADEGWSLLLEDGRHIPVRGPVLIGRNPDPPAGETVTLLPIPQTRLVSKTHLLIAPEGERLFVVDRGSRNGTVVQSVTGETHRCLPQEQVWVEPGSTVSFGDRSVTVQHR